MTSPAAEPNVTDFPQFGAAKQTAIDTFEKDYLTLLFALVGDNISEAARIADVDRGTIYRLMERHDIRFVTTLKKDDTL